MAIDGFHQEKQNIDQAAEQTGGESSFPSNADGTEEADGADK